MSTPNHRPETRRDDLRTLLETRRRQLSEDLRLRIARIRDHGSNPVPANEADDGDPHDLDVRLMEMSTATLRRIDLALERLDDGRYGRCTRCHRAIAEARLRAMPFALCCQRCEAAREHETLRRQVTGRRRLTWTEREAPSINE